MTVQLMHADIAEKDLRMIHDLLQALDSAPLPAAANRRARGRSTFRSTHKVTLIGVAALPSVCVVTRNISTSGLAFIAGQPFADDELFVLCLPITKRRGKAILCTTRFCRYAGHGKFEIGAEFLQTVPMGKKNAVRIPDEWITRAIQHGQAAQTH